MFEMLSMNIYCIVCQLKPCSSHRKGVGFRYMGHAYTMYCAHIGYGMVLFIHVRVFDHPYILFVHLQVRVIVEHTFQLKLYIWTYLCVS